MCSIFQVTMPGVFRNSIQIRLQGPNNVTYTGVLTLKNDSSLPAQFRPVPPPIANPVPALGASNNGSKYDDYDQNGASYYVIAVVLVYGMSIVMLIASHIRRRHAKMQEDKQINKYLHDFQIVKDKQERDNYKQLKKGIVNLLHSDRPPRKTHRNLRKSLIPLIAMGIPSTSVQDLNEGEGKKYNFRRYSFMNRRESFQSPSGQSGERPSIGRRLSLGLLSLMAPRTSTSTRQSSSFNLHSSQNIIEEDEELRQCPQEDHRPSTGSEENSVVSGLSPDKRVPSYIDLPAITITATQARISHQRRRINIMEGLYDDHVPFKTYMEQRVQQSEDHTAEDSTDDANQKESSSSTTSQPCEIDDEHDEVYSLLENEDEHHSPKVAYEKHGCTDANCEVLSCDCDTYEQEFEDNCRSSSDDSIAMSSRYYHPSSLNNNLLPNRSQMHLKQMSKSDISVLSDNEKNSLIEAVSVGNLQSRSTSSLPTAI